MHMKFEKNNLPLKNYLTKEQNHPVKIFQKPHFKKKFTTEYIDTKLQLPVTFKTEMCKSNEMNKELINLMLPIINKHITFTKY